MAGKKKPASGGSLNQLGEILHKAGIRLNSEKESHVPLIESRKKPDSLPPKLPSDATDEEIFYKAMNYEVMVADTEINSVIYGI